MNIETLVRFAEIGTPRGDAKVTEKDESYLQAVLEEAKSQGLRIEVLELSGCMDANEGEPYKALDYTFRISGPFSKASALNILTELDRAHGTNDTRFNPR